MYLNEQVKPQYYAFRSLSVQLPLLIVLLLSFLGDMLLRVCCAMLLCVKSRLLSGDFAANLKLLQHYPDINTEHLLQVARDLSPDTSSYRLSL
ncbi:hypothetical protein QQP08_027474 [Theobroma cacao]|nr:hypothetical protein QQP08_027474 [Theobroma cacao]